MSEQAVILVGGTGRSGTTVLTRILAQHADAVVSPPWRFMIDPDGVLEFLRAARVMWTPYSADVRLKRLIPLLRDVSHESVVNRWRKFFQLDQLQLKFGRSLQPRYPHVNATHFCPRFDTLVASFLGELIAFVYEARWVGTRFWEKHEMLYAPPELQGRITDICARFYQGVIDETLMAQGAKHFVDRNTWNHIWFDELLALIPQARLLHIYRDPRDVVASYMRQQWMPTNAVQAATVYRDLMEYWWKIRASLPAQSYLELSLESLVADPEGILRKICRFLGIPWHDALLSVSLDKSNPGRWRQDIPSNQHAPVHEILRSVLDQLGYTQSND